ncbi:MAG: hypothetical protein AB8G22_11515 [Saprospiraceae bacterium]
MTNFYRFFLSIIAFLILANLLVMNDVATVWSGAEAYNLQLATVQNSAQSFVQQVFAGISMTVDTNPFYARSVSVFIALFGGLAFFALGQKIFGKGTTLATILIAASSLGLIHLGKVATSDIWTATLHTLMVLTQIRYLKQPKVQWQTWHAIFLTLAILATPITTLLFTFLVSAFLITQHPQGRRSVQLYQWILLPVVLVIMAYLLGYSFQTIDSYLVPPTPNRSFFTFYGVALIGTLPWIGFVAAGLWQTFTRFRKKEEFATLMTAWLLGALLLKSFSVLWLFAILAAKQLENFQLKNFPKSNENIIKTFSILNLIFAFCGAIYLMLNSYYIFEAAGFRSAMFTGAVYWMPLLFGVIGLYGKNDLMIRSGFATAGVLVTLTFWFKTYPLLENQRNLPQRVIQTAIGKESRIIDKLILSGEVNNRVNLWYYAQKSGLNVQPITTDDVKQLYSERGAGILILSEDDYQILKTAVADLNAEAVKGWTESGEVETYWVIK